MERPVNLITERTRPATLNSERREWRHWWPRGRDRLSSISGKLIKINHTFIFFFFFSKKIKKIQVLPNVHNEPRMFRSGREGLFRPISWRYLAALRREPENLFSFNALWACLKNKYWGLCSSHT